MKNRHHRNILLLVLGLTFLMAACDRKLFSIPASVSAAVVQPTEEVEIQQENESLPASLPGPWVEDVARVDNQGAVEIELVPLNQNNPDLTLDFNVNLNTHSVDLSMDLATLAILETDTGLSVQASLWDAPRGGHHVSGILSFPAEIDGFPLLEGVSKMTISLIDVDAPERIFVWER